MNTTLDELNIFISRAWKLLLGIALVIAALFWLWGFLTQGTLKLTVNPSPATVFIDRSGHQVQGTASIGLSPEQHQLIVRKEGYLDYKTAVTIKSREDKALSISLLTEPKTISSLARYPVILPDNKTIYFLGSDSRPYQTTTDGGTAQLLKDLIIPNPVKLSWSLDGSRFAAIIPNVKAQLSRLGSPFYSAADADAAPITWIYEISTGRLTKLGINITSFVWSADSKSIFYVPYSSPTAIDIANADGSGARKIADSKFPDIVMKPSPDGKYLSWSDIPEGFGHSDVYVIDLATGSQVNITNNGFSTGASWSPDSRYVLTGEISSKDFLTSLAAFEMSTKKKLDLAVAGAANTSAWIPGSLTFYTYDATARAVAQVDLSTGEIAQILSVDKGAPADLRVSSNGKYLIYTLGGVLYLVKLG